MTMKNVLSRPSRGCLGIPRRAGVTDRMVFPDFQPKLGVQGCRVKVRGGLCGVLPAGVLAGGGGLERVLCTGGMATSHKPPQPCTSLWTRPVDNSARDVMKSPVPACRRAAVSRPPVGLCCETCSSGRALRRTAVSPGRPLLISCLPIARRWWRGCASWPCQPRRRGGRRRRWSRVRR